MQIPSAQSSVLINTLNSISHLSTANKKAVNVDGRVDALTQVDNKTQQGGSSQQTKQRFDIDEKAIASFEQNQLKINTLNQTQQVESVSAEQTHLDSSLSQNKTAVFTYQNISNLTQRESIQQLFGVDLFV